MVDLFTFSIEDSVEFVSGGAFSADKHWKHDTRRHKGDYELIICIKGPVFLSVKNIEYELNVNDILLVPPFQKLTGTRQSTTSISFYWFHFFLPDKTLVFQNKKVDDLSIDHQNPQTIILPKTFRLATLDNLTIIIYQLLSINFTLEKSVNNYYDRKSADYLMTMILLEISKEIVQTSSLSVNNPIINHLEEWIRINLYRSPSVIEMANEVNLNPQYLSRLFKQVVGVPPKQYCIQMKIKTAQSLLVRTNMTIKEISDNTYFKNEKLFMKQFKKLNGMTPSQYRKQFTDIYHNNQNISPIVPIPDKLTKKIDSIPDETQYQENLSNFKNTD